jgi:hypothetical protein
VSGSPIPASERLAALGPYFAAESYDPGGGSPEAPWRSMSELLENADVPAGRVEAVRAYLATAGGAPTESIELRVAASVMHLGLAARTLSPLLALAVLELRVPAAAPVGLRDLRWQPSVGSTFALSIAGLEQAQPSQVAGGADVAVLAAELCELMRPFGVSSRVLGGNVASALNGARIAMSSADPRLAPRARDELARLLSRAPLAGTSRTAPDGRFQRRSCCLIYRAAPDRRGPVCGDCVLLRSMP